jgi:hypothetical protein
MLGYGIYVLYPLLAADSLMREAIAEVAYHQEEASKPPSQRVEALRANPEKFLLQKVIQPLQEAAQLTPGDARLRVQLAWWTGNLWDLKRLRSGRTDPSLEKDALRYGEQAVSLDRHGLLGYLVQARLRMQRFGLANEQAAHQKPNPDPLLVREKEEAARRQYELAARTLEKGVPYDPHAAALHYELAQSWYKAGDKSKGQEHALEALRLDDLARSPARKLTDPQRTQLRDDLLKRPAS